MSSLRPFAFWASWTRRRNYWTDIPPPHHTSRSGNSSPSNGCNQNFWSTCLFWQYHHLSRPSFMPCLSTILSLHKSPMQLLPFCASSCSKASQRKSKKSRETRFDYALGNKSFVLAQCARRMSQRCANKPVWNKLARSRERPPTWEKNPENGTGPTEKWLWVRLKVEEACNELGEYEEQPNWSFSSKKVKKKRDGLWKDLAMVFRQPLQKPKRGYGAKQWDPRQCGLWLSE